MSQSKQTSPTLLRGAMALGALGVLGSYVTAGHERFWANWVFWFVLMFTLGLGALFIVALEHLVNAKWSVVSSGEATGCICSKPYHDLTYDLFPRRIRSRIPDCIFSHACYPAVSGKACLLLVMLTAIVFVLEGRVGSSVACHS